MGRLQRLKASTKALTTLVFAQRSNPWSTVFRESKCSGRSRTPWSKLEAPVLKQAEGKHLLQVLVCDNNVDQALKVLKRKMQREGVFREMKRRRFYEKPSEKTAREKSEAIRRARKLTRKRAQREGLIAAPRKKEPGIGKTGESHRSPTNR